MCTLCIIQAHCRYSYVMMSRSRLYYSCIYTSIIPSHIINYTHLNLTRKDSHQDRPLINILNILKSPQTDRQRQTDRDRKRSSAEKLWATAATVNITTIFSLILSVPLYKWTLTYFLHFFLYIAASTDVEDLPDGVTWYHPWLLTRAYHVSVWWLLWLWLIGLTITVSLQSCCSVSFRCLVMQDYNVTVPPDDVPGGHGWSCHLQLSSAPVSCVSQNMNIS